MISINSRGTENLVSSYSINQINDDVLLIGTDQTSETIDEEAALCRSLAGIFSHTQALHLAIFKNASQHRDLRISEFELLSVVNIKDFEDFFGFITRCQAR